MKNLSQPSSLTPNIGTTRILGELDIASLPPFLRVLLVTDGTVTNILEAFFWESIQVENLGQTQMLLPEDLPLLEATQGCNLLQRGVRLVGAKSGTPYVFARSLIHLDALPEKLRDALLRGKIGIGELIRNSNLETYRALIEIGEKKDGSASKNLNHQSGALIYRLYRISVQQKPAILIAEYFPESLFR